MTGQQKSVYLRAEDIESVKRHSCENARSFSWALRDLLRRGVGVVRLEMDLRELRDELQREG